ncbi:MAG: amino acid synthesis family protein [Lautropia sp.]
MIEIRRVLTQVEDIFHEFGPPPARPLRRGAIAAVLTNPFAGRHVAEILPWMEELNAVGVDMAERLRAAMDVPADAIASYGKGAIVGAAGELEHGALWHVPGGYAMRELLGWKGDRSAYTRGGGGKDAPAASGARSGAAAGTAAERGTPGAAPLKQQPGNALAIVPSTKKVGAPGTMLDVPLTHINASYVRSHFDAIEVKVPGAPRADEIVYILAMTTGARIHARVGGLAAEAIAQWDGLR